MTALMYSALVSIIASSLGSPVPAEAPVLCADPGTTVADERLRELYEGGATFGDFLANALRRKELWGGNYARGADLDAELIERARAVPGTWRFLVVAVDSCSDSVSTIPYLARLVEAVQGLDLRIVDSTVGREVMEAHRTPDGRASTPTVVLMNGDWELSGCFIERPLALRTWITEGRERGEITDGTVFDRKMEWYAEDAGQATLEDFVHMLESAARGRVVGGD